MPDISLTRQTQLRGRPLQDAVASMVHDLSGQSPYNMVEFGWRWTNGAQIALDAPGHMRGTISIRDGSPSTVSIQMDLLSSLARGQRSRVIQDMNAQADRFLAGLAPAQPTTEPPREESWLERRRRERAEREAAEAERPRGEFNWSLFGQIFQNITTGVTGGIGAMNEAYAQTTAEQALDAAGEAAANGKQVFNGAVLHPGKPVGPDEPTPGPTVAPVMAEERGMPTWGWWALGIGGVTAVGLTIWLVRRRGD